MITSNRILWLPGSEERDVAWDDISPLSSRNPSGVRVNSETAMQSTVVLACARLLAESIASLPLHIYEYIEGGGKAPAKKHPLYRLLHVAPNSWQTAFEWREQQVLWLALWGNSYNLLVPGSNGFATELHPLHPSRMAVERIENGRLRYRYRDESGRELIYSQDQIMQIRWLSDDGINGMVPVELARDAIGLARACEIHGARFFGNGARPGFVLTTENDMKPEAASMLRDNWERMHRGADRSNRTAVLFGGLKPMELGGANNQEAQFLETRRFQIEEICRLYRCPPHLVGDLTRSSFSNIEQQSIDFVQHTLLPWLRRFENAFARDLIVEDEKFFAEFDTRGLLRGDAAARASYYSTLTNLGVASVNEIRAWENLNPVDGGDLRFVGLNMQSLEQANAAAKAPPPGSEPPPEAPPQEVETQPTADVGGILAIVQQISAGAVTPEAASAIFASVFPQMPKNIADSIIAGAVVQKEEPPPEMPPEAAPDSSPPAEGLEPTQEGAAQMQSRGFCPTGEGGGIDNSCASKDGSGKSSSESSDGGRQTGPDAKPTKCESPCHTPDVTKDTDNDGVTDAARVGVPAKEVPPPPGLRPLPNLSEREREVESGFMSEFNRDPDGMAAKFRDIVTSSGSPPTFGTDDAKVLTEEWSENDPNTRAENRATLNTALHQTANAIAKRAFVQHLDTLKPGDEILVTVGGCGAGKGYAIKNDPEVLAMKDKSAAVWDSAGDQNATENPWILEEATARGLKVNYVYVHADPKTQWADPNRGVVKRASDPKDGRMVDAQVFADSYAIGAQNHHAFHQANKDNPNATFSFIDNTGPKPARVSGVPQTALSIDRRELAQFAVDTVRQADVPQRVKDGALSGERIWGPVDGDGDGIVNEEEKNKGKK